MTEKDTKDLGTTETDVSQLDPWKRKEKEKLQALDEEQESEEATLNEGE